MDSSRRHYRDGDDVADLEWTDVTVTLTVTIGLAKKISLCTKRSWRKQRAVAALRMVT
jgi:hypothetical protein